MRYNTLKKKHQNIGKGKEKTNHPYVTGWITKDADQRDRVKGRDNEGASSSRIYDPCLTTDHTGDSENPV